MSNPVNDLDLCKTLLNIIDEMYEADGITPVMPTTDAPVDEGKLPAGLQAYQDKKNGKKDDDEDTDNDDDKAKIKDAKGRYSKAVGVMKGKKDEDKEETVEEAVEELQKIMQLAGLESIDEAMSDAYGITSGEPQDSTEGGSVEFKQSKNTDKGSVTIEASADNMEELQKIMQLAGLSLPDLNAPANDEHEADDEPEQEELLLSPDDESPEDESPEDEMVVVSPDSDDESPCGDPEPSGNSDAKQTLVNIIKDKLQQRLK
jgi:hypothetical protein